MAAAGNTAAVVTVAETVGVAAVVEDSTAVAAVASAVGNSAAATAASVNITVVAAVGKTITVKAAGGFCRHAYNDLNYRSYLYRYSGFPILRFAISWPLQG